MKLGRMFGLIKCLKMLIWSWVDYVLLVKLINFLQMNDAMIRSLINIAIGCFDVLSRVQFVKTA
jgi:hypothetical protein